MKDHKHYEAARRAHSGTSFTPERRAESYCRMFDDTIAELKALGIEQYKIDKYEALFVAHLQAKSRCISSMITGPANFPTRRAEKANSAEHARSLECIAYYNKIVAEAKQEAYYEAHPEARPIMAGDSDAVDRYKLKLEAAKKYHAQLKEVKALIKSGMTNEDASAKAGLSAPVAWHSFNIQYANKAVKDLEAKISSLEAAKAKPSAETTINGVRVLENTEAMRLQIFFNGKPAKEMIALLKSHAFKWSPSNMAWQRQLTNNAVYSFNHFVLPAIKAQVTP